MAIARVESGFAYWKVSPLNPNGTYDIGLMQINSAWLPQLAQSGITAGELLQDPCVNLAVGAWILAGNVQRFGYGWKAVGAYNAASPSQRERYAQRVAAALKQITTAQVR